MVLYPASNDSSPKYSMKYSYPLDRSPSAYMRAHVIFTSAIIINEIPTKYVMFKITTTNLKIFNPLPMLIKKLTLL